jgi:hypothetical protein
MFYVSSFCPILDKNPKILLSWTLSYFRGVAFNFRGELAKIPLGVVQLP